MTMLQAVRGMNDILPEATPYWAWVEAVFRAMVQTYGYEEIRLPCVEKTELFKRSIGEATDIVEKEMYTFLDLNQESLTLRPEGTAGCVRAGIEHGLLYHQIQRLWYQGPFFRHERPQKGRYRQFHQWGVEAFGLAGPEIEVEHILLSAAFFEKLGLQSAVTLQLNSLGTPSVRAAYRSALIAYLASEAAHLDEDSLRRMHTNPLRVLDTKNPAMQSIVKKAPLLQDYLDQESKDHFQMLCAYLDQLAVPYEINPFLVRGLDYYTKTVFEWVTSSLGAQGTVCAGGRYDGLVAQLGGKATPALGFAVGMERTVLLLQTLSVPQAQVKPALDIYVVTEGEGSYAAALPLTQRLRKTFPALRLILDCGSGGFKNQLKRADKSGARYALMLGEEALAAGTVILKSLRTEAPQQVILQQALEKELEKILMREGAGFFQKNR